VNRGGRQWWPKPRTRGPVHGGPTMTVAEMSEERTFTGASRSLRVLKKSSHWSAGEDFAGGNIVVARWIVAHRTGTIRTDPTHATVRSSGSKCVMHG